MHTITVHGLATLAAAMLWASLAFGLVSVCVHARHWRRGRREHHAPVRWLQALARLPRRYLVDVHGVVAGHRQTAWMHALLAGGFLATLACWALFPWVALPAWLAVQALGLVAVTGGAVLLGLRRAPRQAEAAPRPQRLSRGRFTALPWAFLAYALGSAVLTGSLALGAVRRADLASMAGAASLMAALLYLVACVRWQPLRHAVFGALYVAAHPKPWRFAARPVAGAEPSARTELSERPPVGRASDFAWTQLLSFDACVECGRCEAVCPAHATGHQLNPKALIQGLVRATGLRAEPYAGQAHAPAGEGTHASSGTGTHAPATGAQVLGIAAETLWSCTTCAACVQACPMFIEHVDAVTDLRRHLTQAIGAMPGKLPEMVREIRESGNSFGQPAAHRWSWATDLQLRTLREVGAADVLVCAGDAGFEPHGQQALRALLRALALAGVDHAILGEEERDCGHLPRRCGDEAAFLALREDNLQTLSRYRFRVLLTADPHALHTLRNEYPAAPWTVLHHTEYLARLLDEGRLRPRAAQPGTVVLHDACYLGRHNGVYDAPRALLRQAGYAMVEAPRSRDNAFCCGGGGGQAWAGQPSRQSIPIVRFEELAATGARDIAVACPNCKLMLQGAAGQGVRIRDVAELLEDTL
ncbi:MAG TPA: DUF3483 domain-containing protein [Pseudorhodoferax sp.]|nr:DUF3483 domain-containing protein [Pseudorhodoferax sp.]